MTTSIVATPVVTAFLAVALFACLPAVFYNLFSLATFPTLFWVVSLTNFLDVPGLLIWHVVEIIVWAVVYYYSAAFLGRWVARARSKVNQAIRLSTVLAAVLGVSALPVYCAMGIGAAAECHTYWALLRELLGK